MGSVNKVILIGNLGADPELKYTPSSKAVCNLRLATNEVWKDKSGEKQEKVEWHRVTVWGDLAENCSKYLAKGRQVYVEGRLETRKWQDKDGNDKYSTEIQAHTVVFLGGKDEGGGRASGGGGGKPSGGGRSAGGGGGRRDDDNAPPTGGDDDNAPPTGGDDDIPF